MAVHTNDVGAIAHHLHAKIKVAKFNLRRQFQ